MRCRGVVQSYAIGTALIHYQCHRQSLPGRQLDRAPTSCGRRGGTRRAEVLLNSEPT